MVTTHKLLQLQLPILLLTRSSICLGVHVPTPPKDVMLPSDGSRSHAAICTKGLPEPTTKQHITVVYGVTLLGDIDQEQSQLVNAQLQSLRVVGLLDEVSAAVHVVLSYGDYRCPPTCNKGMPSAVENLIDETKRFAPNIHIHTVAGNMFEFPALHFLWHKACSHPDDIFLYFHNKGTTRAKLFGLRRAAQEMAVFREVVAPWREIAKLFSFYGKRMQHTGSFPATGGWEWFNFFWVRGSYLQHVAEPMKTSNRYYYESWLSLNGADDCTKKKSRMPQVSRVMHRRKCPRGAYSLSTCSFGVCYEPKNASDGLDRVIKDMFPQCKVHPCSP